MADLLTLKDVIATALPASTKRTVGDLNFDLGGKHYKYAPHAVKPENMPYLLHLFVALTLPSYGLIDVTGYVEEHKLWHCFEVR
jgi:hypothetical protein